MEGLLKISIAEELPSYKELKKKYISLARRLCAASSLARRRCAASTQRRRGTKMTNDDAAPIYIYIRVRIKIYFT